MHELAWGWLGPGRHAVAIDDRAIGFVHGDAAVGFTAEALDGQPLPGTYEDLAQAAAALARAVSPPASRPRWRRAATTVPSAG